MGFGILIFGYMMFLGTYYMGVKIPPEVLGYILIFIALTKLGAYDKKLKAASFATLPPLALSAFKLYTQIAAATGAQLSGSVSTFITVADMALSIVFYTALLLGIASLADSVDLPNVAWKAKRNLVIVFIYYAFTVYTNLYAAGTVPHVRGIEPTALLSLYGLATYALIALMLLLFLSCYMRICLEGDEDMPYEPGRLERRLNSIKEGWKKNK